MLLVGFSVGSVRRKVFNKKFFADFERSTNGVEKDTEKRFQLGYPDNGNGKFGQQLDFPSWVSLANAQRAHMNYVEGVASIVTLVLLAGLFCARFSVFFAWMYIFGRVCYTSGYKSWGPKGRLLGAIVLDLALVALLAFVLYQAFLFGGGLSGLQTFLSNMLSDLRSFAHFN